jgi:hypothetical protein
MAGTGGEHDSSPSSPDAGQLFRHNRQELDLARYARDSRWLPGREPFRPGERASQSFLSSTILEYSSVTELAWRAFVFSLANAGVAENGYVQLWRSLVAIGGRSARQQTHLP